jgi:hypothetical protein
MIYTFEGSSLHECRDEANKSIPHTEKIESVTWEYKKSRSYYYVMVVLTNDWYSYSKYTRGH